MGEWFVQVLICSLTGHSGMLDIYASVMKSEMEQNSGMWVHAF